MNDYTDESHRGDLGAMYCQRLMIIKFAEGVLQKLAQIFGGSQKGGFQKGGFGGCSPVPKPGTRVHSDVPLYQNRNEGTFAMTALLQNHPFDSSRNS